MIFIFVIKEYKLFFFWIKCFIILIIDFDKIKNIKVDTSEVKSYRSSPHLMALKPREKYVISQRYGLEDGVGKTLEQIGNQLGVTRERVRQIESKAFRKLHSPLFLSTLKKIR